MSENELDRVDIAHDLVSKRNSEIYLIAISSMIRNYAPQCRAYQRTSARPMACFRTPPW